MKKSISILLMLVVLLIGCENSPKESLVKFTKDVNLDDPEHPIFYILDSDNPQITAEYLMSAWLQLGVEGKAPSSKWHNGTEWVNNYDTIDAFVITDIRNSEFNGNEFTFYAKFDIKPNKPHNDWEAGNGVPGEGDKEGWIVHKSLFVTFERQPDGGYKKVSAGTGP
jgi:hypothetical protein